MHSRMTYRAPAGMGAARIFAAIRFAVLAGCPGKLLFQVRIGIRTGLQESVEHAQGEYVRPLVALAEPDLLGCGIAVRSPRVGILVRGGVECARDAKIDDARFVRSGNDVARIQVAMDDGRVARMQHLVLTGESFADVASAVRIFKELRRFPAAFLQYAYDAVPRAGCLLRIVQLCNLRSQVCLQVVGKAAIRFFGLFAHFASPMVSSPNSYSASSAAASVRPYSKQ